ncbi:inositol monophosphatase family protein [Hoeflea prorocentri]|uniref:Inositol monophosphatase n=1 Tax=Hoeflea prorocentri TaxID=1922333 RepID=A0A9X3ZH29_9HYPH|nr:inositol monophosphatase [Hoeflea prorocentri]MCY6380355.1 inositol monophosphatase [Hoeflea prorocentri]MDA5398155.1 inositol monophosphatase [Hoeflea prorocentri]
MTFSDSDMTDLVDLLKRTGEEEILPRFRAIEDSDIKQKESAWDVVTEADTAAEECLTAELSQRYPDAFIVGEEATAENPGLIDGLGEAEFAFVIDPVDGTYNFASGMPTFGTILAVIVNGECVAGIIHYPDGGESLVGAAGGGARLLGARGGERRLKVAEPTGLDQMVGTISWGFLKEPERSRIAGNLAGIGMPFAFRCSAWEYRLAAAGRAHFVSAHNLMPWDHLAGVLIHAEAGGYTACLDGSPYGPGVNSGGLITATDPESWSLIRREIFELS